MTKIGSKSGLAIVLSSLEWVPDPKVRVEQYPTDSEIAAAVLWEAYMRQDLKKVIVDMGCGAGILGIGALLLGAQKVYFVESESSALEIAKKNLARLKSEGFKLGEAVFLQKDINEIENFDEKIGVVLQNPPFGTKNRHADKVFLQKAMSLVDKIYSFHKTSTRNFILKFAKDNNFTVTHVWNFKFPLKKTMEFHKKRILRIDVSCFRLERQS